MYDKIFGYKFPFSKNDIIYCPEYSMGAMENPGCITYTERDLFAFEPTTAQETDRCSTILHELAHMWFGDLVTMDWWDDLWLNESFADFVCYLCMHLIIPELTFPLDDAWLTMHFRKSFGYDADESENTTHPIYAEVPDIHTTQSIFDGITYSKGASTLKILYSLIGLDNFSKAMASYFHKHQWKNTKLVDLLDELEAYMPSNAEGCYNLRRFRKDWIEEAGHNVLSSHWDPSSHSKEAKLVIKQTALLEKYSTLRFHKIRVGFYAEGGSLLYIKDVIIEPHAETTVTYDASSPVAGIVLNYDDLDFVKIRLDNQTIDWLKRNYENIESDLTKFLVIRALYDQVKYADSITNYEFLDLACEIISKEKKAFIIELVSSFSSDILFTYSSKRLFKVYSPKLFAVSIQALKKSTEKHFSSQMLDMIIHYPDTEHDFEQLSKWFKNQDEGLKHVESSIN